MLNVVTPTDIVQIAVGAFTLGFFAGIFLALYFILPARKR